MFRWYLFGLSLLILLAGAAPAARAQVSCADVLPTDRVLFCRTGTALRLIGPCPVLAWTQDARLEIDRHVVARDPGGAMDGPYAFTWQAPRAGRYVVEITYALASGGRAVARHLTVQVLDAPPLDWEDGPRDEDDDFPVSLRRAPLKDFRVAQTDVLIDGQALPVDPLDFTAMVPGGALGDGVHRASIEAFDPDGRRYVSPPSFFGVPPRIVFPSPGALVVRIPSETVPLRARVSPLWKPVNITYYVNDVPVASADHAPFLARADLSAYDSGTYQLRAVAVDDQGQTAATPPVSAAIINIPRERAAEAREQAAQRASVAVAQPPAPEPASAASSGTAGETWGVSAGLNPDGSELTGAPILVRVDLRRGSGQSSISGIAGDGAISEAQAAADWIRRQGGPVRDWSQTDVFLTAEASEMQSAAPDGVTDALALYSTLTGKSGDRSVIAIGNVTSSGDFVPAGNLMTKADTALRLPRITTLIVPNGDATTDELGLLSTMKPSLFQGKRIVTAQTMTEVLRAVFGVRATAKSAPRVLTPSFRQIQPLPPLEAPRLPASSAAAPRNRRLPPAEDPLNAQLDQWQALYEKNAASIQSFASQVLHSIGGK